MKSELGAVATPSANGYRVFEVSFRLGECRFFEREIPEQPTDLARTSDFVAYVVVPPGKELDASSRANAKRAIQRRMQKSERTDVDLTIESKS